MLGLLVALAGGLRGARAEEASGVAPAAERPDVFPLRLVRPGMRGHGLTVRHGTTIERFEIEVLDVVKHHTIKQDLILVRCLGEEFADHQIAQGMSGSPIYIEGRCAGALAYTWAWAKHALGGVTPIEDLLAEGRRPLEGRPTGVDLPTDLRRRRGGNEGEDLHMRPIGVPVALGGFSSETRAWLESRMAPLGLTTCSGTGAGAPGGAGDWADRSAPMVPGAALAVDLARGDFSASAIGTCTFVDGDRVYGFGHPFNSMGETELPMSVGYVYGVVASRNLSFKLGGALRPVGTLIQDRPPGVVGVLGREAPMVPFTVAFQNARTGRSETFRFEITPNRIFFTNMAIAALKECFARAETTLGPNTKRVAMTVRIRGMEPWSFEDAVGGFDGGFQRTLIHLLDRPLNHPTQRVVFESFDLSVSVEHADRRALVRAVGASLDEVRPGQEVDLVVDLEKKDGGERVRETLRARIPADAPAGDYPITVIGGDYIPADVPTPVDVADLPAEYDAQLKSTELVAVLPTSRVSVDVDGHLLRSLPLSGLARIARSPGGQALKLRPVTDLLVYQVPYVVVGRATVTLRVVRGPVEEEDR
jgi:hypothetical protein